MNLRQNGWRCRARTLAKRAAAFSMAASFALLVGCQNSDLSGGPELIPAAPEVGPEDPCPAPRDLPVVINEVMLLNVRTIAAPGGEFLPWIELYNPSVDPFDLGGATITDDLADPEKWELPCGPDSILDGGEHLLLFFSDEAYSTDDHIIDFLPAATGIVRLYLIGDNTLESAEIDASALDPDTSAGRTPDGEGGIVILLFPTPGSENSEPLVAPPTTFVRGDVDQDGDVDLDDLALLNAIIFGGGGPLPACLDRLDVNDDGEVDIADPNFLALALAPGGPSVPPPFPAAGIDPSPDETPCEEEVTP